MKTCAQTAEVQQMVRSGHWPQACPAELREHIAGCAVCAQSVALGQVFSQARTTAMARAPLASPGVLWWRAQLRRRNEALQRVEAPAVAAKVLGAALCVAVVALLAIWKRQAMQLEVLQSLRSFVPTGWSLPVMVAAAVSLAIFTAVVLWLLGEERRSEV